LINKDYYQYFDGFLNLIAKPFGTKVDLNAITSKPSNRDLPKEVWRGKQVTPAIKLGSF
jgi:hypothetical protein